MRSPWGVRAFDFRILYNASEKAFYLSHSFTTVPLETALKEIQKFMQLHTSEVLVIEIQDDFEHMDATAPYHDQAIQLVNNFLKEMLVPVSSNYEIDSLMTLENLVQKKQRIFLQFINSDKSIPNVWPGRKLVHEYWPNGQKSTESITRIEEQILPIDSNGQFNLVFFTVTLDETSIFNNFLRNLTLANRPTNLKSFAAEIAPLSELLINKNLCTRLKGLSIISLDWITDADIQNVIHWNSDRTNCK